MPEKAHSDRYSPGLLVWLMDRGVCLKSAMVSVFDLSVLRVYHENHDPIVLPTITSIVTEPLQEDFHVWTLIRTFPNMTSIKCVGTGSMGPAFWAVLSNCPNLPLRRLNIPKHSAHGLGAFLMQFGAQIVEFRPVHSKANLLQRRCPLLEALTINTEYDLQLPLNLLRMCPYLIELVFMKFSIYSLPDIHTILTAAQRVGHTALQRFSVLQTFSYEHFLFAEIIEQHQWLEFVQINDSSYQRSTRCLQITSECPQEMIERLFDVCHIQQLAIKVVHRKVDHNANVGVFLKNVLTVLGPGLTELTVEYHSKYCVKLSTTVIDNQGAELLDSISKLRLGLDSFTLLGLPITARRLVVLTFLRYLKVSMLMAPTGAERSERGDQFNGMIKFIAQCKQLKELHFGDASAAFDKECLKTILSSKSPLEKLSWDMIGFSAKDLREFRKQAKDLQRLPIPQLIGVL